MTPTVRDVVGAPVPGLPHVPHVRPPQAVPFRTLLDQLRHRTSTPSPLPQLRPAGRPHPATMPKAPAAVRSRRTEATPPAARSTPRQALAARIRRAAAGAGVEPALSVAVARAESNLDPSARSPDGISVGTFQVTHATRAEMHRKFAAGVVARPAGTDDVSVGVGYLRYLQDIFGRSTKLGGGLATVPVTDLGERRLIAIAAYNAGEGRVAGAQARAAASGLDPTRYADVRRFLPGGTQVYVDRVVAYASEEAKDTAVA